MSQCNKKVFIDRYWYILATSLVLLMLFSSYSNTFHSPPVLDDFHTFVEEPIVQIKDLSFETLASIKNSKFGWQRWIPMVTLAWDIWLGDGEIIFLHLTNYLIHVLCFISALLLVYQISKHARRIHTSKEVLPQYWVLAIWVAALWALNPLQTNAVTYLVQRMASIVTLFFLISLNSYIAARSNYREKGCLTIICTIFCISSLLSMILAFLSKENALMLPVMLFLTEAWIFSPHLFNRIFRFWRDRISLSAVVFCFIVFLAWFLISHEISPRYAHRHFTLSQRLLTESRIVIWYISAFLFPHPNRLSLEHDVELSTSLISPISTLFSIVLISLMAWAAISRRRTYPLISYGLMWFLLNLLIESSFIPLELIFEHRMYLPSIGLVLSMIVAAYTLSHSLFQGVSAKDLRIVSWCLFALVSSALTLGTFYRNAVWQDGVSINADNVMKAPKNPRAHANLGVALSRVGRYEEAIQKSKTAIEQGIKYFEEYNVAANTIVRGYVSMGNYEQAILEGERLLREQPSDCDALSLPSLYVNLALAYKGAGNLQEAFQTLQKVLVYSAKLPRRAHSAEEKVVEILGNILQQIKSASIDLDQDGTPDPRDLQVKTWIAREFLRLGSHGIAERLFTESLAEDPMDHTSRQFVEAILEQREQNQAQSGKWSFKHKYVYNPLSRFNAGMAMAFLICERRVPADFLKIGEYFLDGAMNQQPNAADAHLLKGWYHYKRDEAQQAVAATRRALEIDPDYAKAWMGLGFFLAKANQPQEAIVALQKSLEVYPGYPQRRAIMDIISELQAKLTPAPDVVAASHRVDEVNASGL